MDTYTEGNHAGEFMVSEAEGNRSRDAGVVATGQGVLAAGTVMARSTAETMSVAAADADSGNTGDGTVTLADPAFGEDVVPGLYTLRCTAAATNAGTFELIDPDGDVVDGKITVGDALDGSHLKLTVNDGATDFAVGDFFTIAVKHVAFGKYYQFAPAGADGVEIASAILYREVDTTDADVNEALITRDAEVNGSALTWPDDIEDDDKFTATSHLEAVGIIVR